MACLLLQSWVFGQRERFTHGLCVCQVQNKQNLSPMDQWPKRGKSISTSYWALIFVHFDNKIKTSDARIVDSVQVKSIFGSFWAGPQHTHTIFYAALLGWALDFHPCPFFWDSPNSTGIVLLFVLVRWVAAEISLSSSCCQCGYDKGNGLNGSQNDPEKVCKSAQGRAVSREIYCVSREDEVQFYKVARRNAKLGARMNNKVISKNFSSEY